MRPLFRPALVGDGLRSRGYVPTVYRGLLFFLISNEGELAVDVIGSVFWSDKPYRVRWRQELLRFDMDASRSPAGSPWRSRTLSHQTTKGTALVVPCKYPATTAEALIDEAEAKAVHRSRERSERSAFTMLLQFSGSFCQPPLAQRLLGCGLSRKAIRLHHPKPESSTQALHRRDVRRRRTGDPAQRRAEPVVG